MTSTHLSRQRRVKRSRRMVLRLREHFPPGYFLLIEAVLGILGFPGIGWIFSGKGSLGLGIAIISPIFAWVGVPILMTLYHLDAMTPIGPVAILAYLAFSTLLSVTALAVSLYKTAQSLK